MCTRRFVITCGNDSLLPTYYFWCCRSLNTLNKYKYFIGTKINVQSTCFYSSHGWASTIAAIRGPHVKVICPTASTMPVTLNAGFRMPSWFDLRTLDATAPEDEEGILRATQLVHAMIADEIKVGSSR